MHRDLLELSPEKLGIHLGLRGSKEGEPWIVQEQISLEKIGQTSPSPFSMLSGTSLLAIMEESLHFSASHIVRFIRLRVAIRTMCVNSRSQKVIIDKPNIVLCPRASFCARQHANALKPIRTCSAALSLSAEGYGIGRNELKLNTQNPS